MYMLRIFNPMFHCICMYMLMSGLRLSDLSKETTYLLTYLFEGVYERRSALVLCFLCDSVTTSLFVHFNVQLLLASCLIYARALPEYVIVIACVRSVNKMLPSVKFAEDKVLTFLMFREKC